MLLGYSPSQVARSYYLLIGTVNLLVLVLAASAALAASTLWQPQLHDLGIEPSAPWSALGIGAAIICFVTVLNFLSIRRIVARNFYNRCTFQSGQTFFTPNSFSLTDVLL